MELPAGWPGRVTKIEVLWHWLRDVVIKIGIHFHNERGVDITGKRPRSFRLRQRQKRIYAIAAYLCRDHFGFTSGFFTCIRTARRISPFQFDFAIRVTADNERAERCEGLRNEHESNEGKAPHRQRLYRITGSHSRAFSNAAICFGAIRRTKGLLAILIQSEFPRRQTKITSFCIPQHVAVHSVFLQVLAILLRSPVFQAVPQPKEEMHEH